MGTHLLMLGRIQSSLSNCQQIDKVSEWISKAFNKPSGVPQGSQVEVLYYFFYL